MKLVAPSEHLDFWPQSMQALGGLAVLNHPMDMHFYSTDHPESVLDLGLYDMRTNETPFLAYIQLIPMRKEKSFAAFADSFLQNLNSQKLTDDALAWRHADKETTTRVTACTHSAIASKKVNRDTYVKWALVGLDEDHLVLINFTICPANARERERYDSAADKMVRSVQKSKSDRK